MDMWVGPGSGLAYSLLKLWDYDLIFSLFETQIQYARRTVLPAYKLPVGYNRLRVRSYAHGLRMTACYTRLKLVIVCIESSVWFTNCRWKVGEVARRLLAVVVNYDRQAEFIYLSSFRKPIAYMSVITKQQQDLNKQSSMISTGDCEVTSIFGLCIKQPLKATNKQLAV